MTNPQKTNRHHFVPECYLKNFITDTHLVVLDIRNVQKGYKTKLMYRTPGQICYLEQYYSINNTKPSPLFSFEDLDNLFIENVVLRSLEDIYPKLIKALTTSEKLPKTSAKDIAKFIIQLKLRNPYWFEKTIQKNLPEWMEQSLDSVFTELMNKPEFHSLKVEEKKLLHQYLETQYKLTDQMPSSFQKASLITRYQGASNDDIIYDSILKASWTLLEAPANGPYFITSDNPGFSLTNEGNINNTRFTDGFSFCLPISPQFCLIVSDAAYDHSALFKPLNKVQVPGQAVIQINDKTIQLVNRILIASEGSYLQQIAELNRPLV